MGSISVRDLGKAYKQYPTRGARLAEWLIPFGGVRHTQKWVLQGLNFEVKPGEAIGIIGMNGAGKSTLLKMITGTTEPTTGSISVSGSIAALLELGMGFHPDFTGRQNAIMAGQLLGLSSDDIQSLMPAIEAFAEIGQTNLIGIVTDECQDSHELDCLLDGFARRMMECVQAGYVRPMT
ncbi:MAG: ATP-binding cassette domain-containing protein, partial [Alcaligenaceae bacterium]